jgi:glutamate racemase
MSAQQPIGIFDSGIGGLTVANAIQQVLPNESLIYFGDTAHLPYGEKSAEAILAYSLRISEFLRDKNCKAIVIACNTASSIAYEAVKAQHQGHIPVIDVINPVVNAVASEFQQGKIGVIATKATIRSNVYAKKLKQLNTSLEVASLATPLLVPMIEEGFYNSSISKEVIASYLSQPVLQNIDALILACTHFPLIRAEIEAYYKHQVKIVDSAEIVARYVKEQLTALGLLNTEAPIAHHFYVSDYTNSFEQSTKLFFKGAIHLEHCPLWD